VTNAARKIIDEALSLSDAERAEIASEIIASLDGPADTDHDEAWAAEIEKRARRAVAGDSAGRPWGEVRAEIEAQLRRR
jgi:putative addiction module component (TIGR02574 family)